MPLAASVGSCKCCLAESLPRGIGLSASLPLCFCAKEPVGKISSWQTARPADFFSHLCACAQKIFAWQPRQSNPRGLHCLPQALSSSFSPTSPSASTWCFVLDSWSARVGRMSPSLPSGSCPQPWGKSLGELSGIRGRRHRGLLPSGSVTCFKDEETDTQRV